MGQKLPIENGDHIFKIPVLEESKLFADPPDYALLLSWHIADELIPKLKEKGYKGKFIIPLPNPRVIA